jgi:hypothetical protein
VCTRVPRAKRKNAAIRFILGTPLSASSARHGFPGIRVTASQSALAVSLDSSTPSVRPGPYQAETALVLADLTESWFKGAIKTVAGAPTLPAPGVVPAPLAIERLVNQEPTVPVRVAGEA